MSSSKWRLLSEQCCIHFLAGSQVLKTLAVVLLLSLMQPGEGHQLLKHIPDLLAAACCCICISSSSLLRGYIGHTVATAPLSESGTPQLGNQHSGGCAEGLGLQRPLWGTAGVHAEQGCCYHHLCLQSRATMDAEYVGAVCKSWLEAKLNRVLSGCTQQPAS